MNKKERIKEGNLKILSPLPEDKNNILVISSQPDLISKVNDFRQVNMFICFLIMLMGTKHFIYI